MSGGTTGPARLEAAELGVHFGDRPALEGVSLALHAGETVSLVGPNGAGKSTLLRALAGMLPPSHGEVRFEGRPVRRPNPCVVYVPQRSGVDWSFPVDVLGVVLMGQAHRRTRLLPFLAGDRAAARAALARVKMDRFAGVQIGQLSGGQQQRVFLARALVQGGEVYLLDEPFAGVDVPTQELLIDLFDGLRREGKTIVYATHDLGQAARASDRVVLVNRRLVAAGPPERVMTATNLRETFGGQVVVVGPSGGPVAGGAADDVPTGGVAG